MRELIIGALALVVGVVLGGLLPRAEVRRLEGEVAEMRQHERARGSGVGSDLAGLFIRPPLPDADPIDEAPVADVQPSGVPAPGDPVEAGDGPDAPSAPSEPGQELEAAKTALRLRSAQARASLEEDAGPDEAQMQTIDAAVADMNSELHGLAEELVAQMADGREPTRHEAMVFAADALDIVITAEDRMTEALDPDQREAVAEEALDPFSYIDPSLLDVLSGLDP